MSDLRIFLNVIILIILLWGQQCGHAMTVSHVAVKGQFCGVSSLILLVCGLQESKSGQASMSETSSC